MFDELLDEEYKVNGEKKKEESEAGPAQKGTESSDHPAQEHEEEIDAVKEPTNKNEGAQELDKREIESLATKEDVHFEFSTQQQQGTTIEGKILQESDGQDTENPAESTEEDAKALQLSEQKHAEKNEAVDIEDEGEIIQESNEEGNENQAEATEEEHAEKNEAVDGIVDDSEIVQESYGEDEDQAEATEEDFENLQVSEQDLDEEEETEECIEHVEEIASLLETILQAVESEVMKEEQESEVEAERSDSDWLIFTEGSLSRLGHSVSGDALSHDNLALAAVSGTEAPVLKDQLVSLISSFDLFKDGMKDVAHFIREPPRRASVDRTRFYENYNQLLGQCKDEEFMHDVLELKLWEYYRSRKMFHLFYESTVPTQAMLDEYDQTLNAFTEAGVKTKYQEDYLRSELDELKEEYLKKSKEADEFFDRVQQMQLQAGIGPYTSEEETKLLQQSLIIQKDQMNDLAKIRLKSVKLKNRIEDKQKILNELDDFGSDIHLGDFEQLKSDSVLLRDKVEEMNRKVTARGERCRNAVQVLAQVKTSIRDQEYEIRRLHNHLYILQNRLTMLRKKANVLKQEKNRYRKETDRLREDSGLLYRPEILKDFMNTFRELASTSVRLQDLKGECGAINQEIEAKKQIINAAKDMTFLL